jgi:hypothetical protein
MSTLLEEEMKYSLGFHTKPHLTPSPIIELIIKTISSYPSRDFFETSPSLDTPEKKNFLQGLIGDIAVETVDRYRGSRDGFYFEDFHKRADNIGPTISLFKMRSGDVIGGLTFA